MQASTLRENSTSNTCTSSKLVSCPFQVVQEESVCSHNHGPSLDVSTGTTRDVTRGKADDYLRMSDKRASFEDRHGYRKSRKWDIDESIYTIA